MTHSNVITHKQSPRFSDEAHYNVQYFYIKENDTSRFFFQNKVHLFIYLFIFVTSINFESVLINQICMLLLVTSIKDSANKRKRIKDVMLLCLLCLGRNKI